MLVLVVSYCSVAGVPANLPLTAAVDSRVYQTSDASQGSPNDTVNRHACWTTQEQVPAAVHTDGTAVRTDGQQWSVLRVNRALLALKPKAY